jgi:hypothetical protein
MLAINFSNPDIGQLSRNLLIALDAEIEMLKEWL